MTIKELKAEIKDLPDNLEVMVNYDAGYVNPARSVGVMGSDFGPTAYILDVWGAGNPMIIKDWQLIKRGG